MNSHTRRVPASRNAVLEARLIRDFGVPEYNDEGKHNV